MKKPKIIIDCATELNYSSFYIEGLYTNFGKERISFSFKSFLPLRTKEKIHSFDHILAFEIKWSEKNTQKFIIDFRDDITFSKGAYEWCDKYAKINFNFNLSDKSYFEKVIPIPPSFGINIWNYWQTAYFFITNYIKRNKYFDNSFENFLRTYYNQLKRSKLTLYETNKCLKRNSNNENYIFMIATLWSHQNCLKSTNLWRKLFIEICKKKNINFEGGFYIPQNHTQLDYYKNYSIGTRYSIDEYIKKTKKSLIVFNTPSVHNCHGWKLGEYLAMGKAIISTPISNQLPEELVHGENIHIINSEIELESAIDILISDNEYRKKLEYGAKKYYLKYVKPNKVIDYIINQDINQISLKL